MKSFLSIFKEPPKKTACCAACAGEYMKAGVISIDVVDPVGRVKTMAGVYLKGHFDCLIVIINTSQNLVTITGKIPHDTLSDSQCEELYTAISTKNGLTKLDLTLSGTSSQLKKFFNGIKTNPTLDDLTLHRGERISVSDFSELLTKMLSENKIITALSLDYEIFEHDEKGNPKNSKLIPFLNALAQTRIFALRILNTHSQMWSAEVRTALLKAKKLKRVWLDFYDAEYGRRPSYDTRMLDLPKMLLLESDQLEMVEAKSYHRDYLNAAACERFYGEQDDDQKHFLDTQREVRALSTLNQRKHEIANYQSEKNAHEARVIAAMNEIARLINVGPQVFPIIKAYLEGEWIFSKGSHTVSIDGEWVTKHIPVPVPPPLPTPADYLQRLIPLAAKSVVSISKTDEGGIEFKASFNPSIWHAIGVILSRASSDSKNEKTLYFPFKFPVEDNPTFEGLFMRMISREQAKRFQANMWQSQEMTRGDIFSVPQLAFEAAEQIKHDIRYLSEMGSVAWIQGRWCCHYERFRDEMVAVDQNSADALSKLVAIEKRIYKVVKKEYELFHKKRKNKFEINFDTFSKEEKELGITILMSQKEQFRFEIYQDYVNDFFKILKDLKQQGTLNQKIFDLLFENLIYFPKIKKIANLFIKNKLSITEKMIEFICEDLFQETEMCDGIELLGMNHPKKLADVKKIIDEKGYTEEAKKELRELFEKNPAPSISRKSLFPASVLTDVESKLGSMMKKFIDSNDQEVNLITSYVQRVVNEIKRIKLLTADDEKQEELSLLLNRVLLVLQDKKHPDLKKLREFLEEKEKQTPRPAIMEIERMYRDHIENAHASAALKNLLPFLTGGVQTIQAVYTDEKSTLQEKREHFERIIDGHIKALGDMNNSDIAGIIKTSLVIKRAEMKPATAAASPPPQIDY